MRKTFFHLLCTALYLFSIFVHTHGCCWSAPSTDESEKPPSLAIKPIDSFEMHIRTIDEIIALQQLNSRIISSFSNNTPHQLPPEKLQSTLKTAKQNLQYLTRALQDRKARLEKSLEDAITREQEKGIEESIAKVQASLNAINQLTSPKESSD